MRLRNQFWIVFLVSFVLGNSYDWGLGISDWGLGIINWIATKTEGEGVAEFINEYLLA